MQAYVDPGSLEPGSFARLMALTPLHLIWLGNEAVYLFFVLSGFVLVLPFLRSGRSLVPYYPRRLVRLYLPVWGAFVLAVLWMTVLPRHFGPGSSIWLRSHIAELTPEAVTSDLLLFPLPFWTNSALWSLRYEVGFSLLLPVYLILGRRAKSLNLLKFLVLLAAVFYFTYQPVSPWGLYLPMFGVGTVMAFERQRLGRWAEAISRSPRSGLYWTITTLVSLGMLNSYWTVYALVSDPQDLRFWVSAARGMNVLGACLAVFVCLRASRFMQSRVVQWLGTRSFSLYLVHEPVVVSTAVLLGGMPSVPVSLAISVPVSLLLAEAFFRVVEKPSHRLSRKVGRWAERAATPAPAPAMADQGV